MTRISIALLAAAATLAPAAFAAAQPQPVATYQDWQVYTAELGEDTVCYAISAPTELSPSTVSHGQIYFMVSTWESGVTENQPSFLAGYNLQENSEPLVRIGGDSWQMFSAGAEGFVESDTDEDRIIAAMRRGSEMRVSALSQRGNATEYAFSLFGISSALDRVERACN